MVTVSARAGLACRRGALASFCRTSARVFSSAAVHVGRVAGPRDGPDPDDFAAVAEFTTGLIAAVGPEQRGAVGLELDETLRLLRQGLQRVAAEGSKTLMQPAEAISIRPTIQSTCRS